MNLKKYIRTIPDFPKKGVMFRDVTTLFNNHLAFGEIINQFHSYWCDDSITSIAGIDARGFIIGGALAYRMKKPFVAVRKKGRLPHDTVSQEYDLEYGRETLEIHRDAIMAGDRVLIIDDLIATGGTAVTSVNLVQSLDGEVAGCSFLIDLPLLFGSAKLESMGIKVKSLLSFDGN